jgi:hypothetical protein
MTTQRFSSTLLILLAAPCLAQEWQAGGGGGYSLYRNLTASNATGTVQSGFNGGFAVSAIALHEMHRWVGGELRYEYLQNEMKVSGGGQQVTFSGQSHAIHYDLILNATPKESKIRPFVAVGGGGKYYRGTGKESAYQPLDDFVVLTATSEFMPLVSAGGGVKFRISPRVNLRLEFRDFMTPVPTKVITPVPGTKLEGWYHNFVPMLALTFGLKS